MTLTTEIENANVPASLIDRDEPAPAADDKKAPPAATDETADPAAPAAETTEQQEARKQSKFQRRLQRQRDRAVAAETETRLLREQKAQLEAKLQSQQPGETGEPKRDQFEDYEAYLRAVAKYDAAQETAKGLKADREERQGKERQTNDAKWQERAAKDWAERETAFQAATKDYVETVTPFVEEELGSFSDGARRLIVESELGPQLLHHLATHPEVAERIADLSPVRQVAELGKVEGTLSPEPAAKPKSTTKAPAPPTPTNGGRSASPGYSENMTDAEYEAWRIATGPRPRWARH